MQTVWPTPSFAAIFWCLNLWFGHVQAQGASEMPRVIVDVGDVLHCYKKAVKGQINQVDPWNLWKGLEIVLEHFRESGHEVIGVIPQRRFPDIPHALRLEIADLVAAPKGFSLELLESVAATAASGGDILSNRNLVDLGLRAWQIHFSFSSQSRFFLFFQAMPSVQRAERGFGESFSHFTRGVLHWLGCRD